MQTYSITWKSPTWTFETILGDGKTYNLHKLKFAKQELIQ